MPCRIRIVRIAVLAIVPLGPVMAQEWQERQAWDWGQHRTSLVEAPLPLPAAETRHEIEDWAPSRFAEVPGGA